MEKFDGIIIGAGQAGNPLSTAFSKAGKKIALIEEKYVGGTCINYGCTPTKTMIASAQAAYLARHSKELGVNLQDVAVDLQQIRKRKDEIVTSFRSGSERRIVEGGVSLIRGKAVFTGVKTLNVAVDGGSSRQLTAETIIINAGGRPRVPEISGLSDVSYLDSSSIMELEKVPEHLIVLGGGYVALEFGQMFRRFGSQVTIIQHTHKLLGREDEDVAGGMLEILEKEDIEVLLDSETRSVSQNSAGRISLSIRSPQGEMVLEGSHLLIATGRTPNSDRLDLGKTNVSTDAHGFIQVDDRLETNVPGIYAAGDIKGGPAFTHIAYDDFRILKTNLLDNGHATIQDRLVPYVLFTDPQLGRIGLTEIEARKAGLNFRVAKIPMNYVARAIETDRTLGFMKALVDIDTQQILGAAFLGVEGGELMAMIEIAMMGRMPYTLLRDGIFAHPTLAESLNTLFAGLP